MNGFTFSAPTQIIFGRGAAQQVGEQTARCGNTVLLHFGGGSIRRTGLYDRVVTSLEAAGLRVVELAGVQPNPRVALVREGVALCRAEGVEVVLAVGGGSVIDSAKAIAFGVCSDRDVLDFFTEHLPIEEALPVGTVLTLPAAGSEGSPVSVISDAASQRKMAISADALRPVFSILDPELTLSLPPVMTGAGIADMFSHISERYFTPTGHVSFIDHMAEGAMRGILHDSRRLMVEPDNVDLRAEIMLAGMMAHNGVFGLGRQVDWMCHGIEHQLSAIWDIPHGEGLAIVIPAWMRRVFRQAMPRFARFSREVFGISEVDEERRILTMIDTLQDWYRLLGLKTALSQYDCFDASQIPAIARRCIPEGQRRGALCQLSFDDIEAILRMAS